MSVPHHTPRQLKAISPNEIERRFAALVDELIGAEPGTTEATLIRTDFAPPAAAVLGAIRGMTDITLRLQQSPNDDDISWLHGSKPPLA